MKVLSRTIKVFFIVIGLLLLALLAFVATFDVENYRPQIIAQVEKVTGREFTIGGDIGLSIFPWVGLKVEDVALGNAAGFTAEKFAQIKQLDIKVNLLPLLKKEVQVNTIRLHGLNVSLEVAKDKSDNWSGLVRSEAPAEEAGKAVEQPSKPPVLQALYVQGLELVDAQIHYDDRSSNTRASVSEVNLTTSEIQFNQPVDINFAAHLENSQPRIDTRLKLSTRLVFNNDFTEFGLSNFIAEILVKANEFIKQDEKLVIKSDIAVSMDAQQVAIKQLQLTALDTTTQAEINISQFLQSPFVQGSIEVLPFNAVATTKRAGIALPAMAKADALHHVSLKTNIKLQGEKLEANDVSLLMDGSTLSGWLHVINLSKQQLRYDLALDQLNVNDYMPPVAEQAVNDRTKSGGVMASSNPAAAGDEKIKLPLELLRQLDVEGDLRVNSLIASQYEIKQLLMRTSAQKGVINIDPLSMQLLDGQLNSAIKMNAVNAIPAYTVKLDAKRLQAGPVANPIIAGMMGEKPITMKGAVNLAMDVNTRGETVNQLKKASSGQIVLDMNTTEVNGFDPEFYMRSSVANYIDSKGAGLSKTIMGNYEPREVTVFDKIHSTVKLADGKATTKDFLMDSLRVQVRAEGQVDIMQNSMDVTSSIKLPRGQTVLEKILDEPMFVRVHGPFENLAYDIDTDRLKKSTTDVLENEAKAKLEAEKQRLKAKADEEKRRAEEKAKQELQKKADELQDELKNKLKGLF
ncbi:MAG: AsmA family protein [Gammaproteobacteria bacterium]|nr:AsmA family protein [Gammaproteobacteria bacterium]